MIDLHSHILPSIDDGARTLDDTLLIAEDSVRAGITHMLCTPHIHLGIFDNNKESIENSFQLALTEIHKANIPLKLGIGAEVRICPEVITLIQQNSLPYVGKWRNKNALLLELPHSHIPPGTEQLILWLKKYVQPIVPHPERNRDILANYSKGKWLKQLGCIFQVTAGAFIGRFGDTVMDTVWRMQQDNLIAYVASDTHNVKKRPNDMREAYEEVKIRTNNSVANAYFKKMPEYLSSEVNWQ